MKKNGIKHDAVKTVLNANKSLLSSLVGEQHIIVQKIDRVVQGSTYKRTFTFLGHLANFMGIVVAIADVAKGWGKNDRASTISGMLMGGASTAFFFADLAWVGKLAPLNILGKTFVITRMLNVVGLVLFAAAMVFYYFTDNEIEAWVRSGFWGDSDEYWDIPREELTLEKCLSRSKSLAKINDTEYEKINTFYEKEMADFYNLILGLSVKNDIKGDNKLRVYCPLFDSEESVHKLSVEWQQQTIFGGPGERGEQLSDLDSANIKKTYLFSNCIELDFSQAQALGGKIPTPDSLNRGRQVLGTLGILNLKYPKIGKTSDYFETQRLFGKNEI